MDELFKKQNKLQVSTFKTVENDDFAVVEKVKEEKSFFNAQDKKSDIQWDRSTLLAESLDGYPVGDNIFLSDKSASDLYKLNKKYSAKSRKSMMKKAKEIRTKKLQELANSPAEGKTATKRLEDEINKSRKIIKLDAEARENYIKATMTDSSDERLDLYVNRIRKYYRLGRLYSEYLQKREALDMSVETKIMLDEELEEVQKTLQKELDGMKGEFADRFSWELVTGDERKYVKEDKTKKSNNIKKNNIKNLSVDLKAEAAEAEAVKAEAKSNEAEKAEEPETFKLTEARLNMIRTGKLGSKQVEKRVGTEWVLGNYVDAVAERFKDREYLDDTGFIRELINYNTIMCSNLKLLKREVHQESWNDVTLGFEVLQDRMFELASKKIADKMLDKSVFTKGDLTLRAELKDLMPKSELEVYRKRKEMLDKSEALRLKERGADIWKSKALQSLVLGKEDITDNQLKAIEKQAGLMSDMVRKIVNAKYGRLIADDVYKKVMEHLGDNALFGSYGRVATEVSRYMDTMQFEDRKAARLQRDFDKAYGKCSELIFRDQLKGAAETFIIYRKDWWDEQDGNRRKLMIEQLKLVHAYQYMLVEETVNRTMSRESWDKLVDKAKDVISKDLGRMVKMYGRLDKNMLNDLRNDLRNEIKKIETAEKSLDKSKKLTRNEYREAADNSMMLEGIKKSDFSYGGRLLGEECLQSEAFREVFTASELGFLSENLSQIIFSNDKLKEALPFVKEVKGLDQLDGITNDQYETLKTYLKDMVKRKGFKEAVKKMHDNDRFEEEDKQHAFLELMSKEISGDKMLEHAEKRLQEKDDKVAQDAKTAQRKLLCDLGAQTLIRDGKIRYHFTDRKDLKKKALHKHFGVGSDWFYKREQHYELAAKLWDKAESLGAEVSEQLRRWIDKALEQKKPGDYLEDLARTLRGEKPKKKEIFVIDEDLKKSYDKGQGHDLLFVDAMKSLVNKPSKKKNKDTKETPLEDYAAELFMLGNQDILFSHGGSAQDVFFEYDEKTYRKKLFAQAKIVSSRMKRLDEDLSGYSDAVRKELKNKLARRYLAFATTEEDKLDKLNFELDQLQKRVKYEKDEKRLEELKKKIEGVEGKIKNAYTAVKKERLANKAKFGHESLNSLRDFVKKNISTSEGVMSKEMQDAVELHEKRRSMITSFGAGELAPIADWLLKQEQFRKALYDDAESVARNTIEEIHRKYASFGKAYVKADMSPQMGEYFLEQQGKNLLSDKSVRDEKYYSNLLTGFKDSYVTAVRGDAGSIDENMRAKANELKEKLAKYYYNSEEVKKELEAEGLTTRNISKRRQKAYRLANGRLQEISAAIMKDPELFQKTFDEESLNKLYFDMAVNYLVNDKTIQREYNALIKEHPELKELLTVAGLDLFRGYVCAKAVTEDRKTFKKNIKKYFNDYLNGVKNVSVSHSVLVTESKKNMEKKNARRQEAERDMMLKKSATRNAFDKILFGGNTDRIKQFGSQRRSLAYEHSKGNKNLKSKGKEDDNRLWNSARQILQKAGKDKKDFEVPNILVNILDEYMRFNDGIFDKLDRVADWISDEKNEFMLEAERLIKVYEQAKAEEIPQSAMELFTVYAVRFSDRDSNLDVKSAAKHFKEFYGKFSELEAYGVTHPDLVAMKKDSLERLRMLLFSKGEALSRDEMAKMVDSQMAFFAYAEKAYKVVDETIAKNTNTKRYDKLFANKLKKGVMDYYNGRFVKDAVAKKEFDEESFKTELNAMFNDAIRVQAFMTSGHVDNVTIGDNIGSQSFYEENNMPGTFGQKDFEKAVSKIRTYVKAYNGLNDKQREMLAIALYTLKQTDTGTMNVLYGEHNEELKENRALFMKYIKGEKVEFKVDYGRALRCLDVRQTDTKDFYDEKLLAQAYDFVQLIEKRKSMLKKDQDWDVLSDYAENIKSLESFTSRNQLAEYKKAQKLSTKKGFMDSLIKYSETDLAEQRKAGVLDVVGKEVKNQFNKERIQDIIHRLNNLEEHQQRLVIYLLQDRTALDYSSGGRNGDNKVWGFANDVKRALLIDKLKDPKEKEKALLAASSEDMIKNAMGALLSFQLKDHENISKNGFKREDFASGALDRKETIDWQLLNRAMDLVDEIEGEQRRLLAVRKSSEWLTEDLDKKDESAAKEIYRKHKDEMVAANKDQFEKFFIENGRLDAAIHDGNAEEIDTLLEGYLSLTDEEKALFVRALEHRDILDISQKNLYRDFFGTSEDDRNYVNAKGRDELIDEFLETTYGAEGHVNLKKDSYEKAFVSLLTTQVNDDMKFENAKKFDWTNKNMYTNNQIFVRKRKTAIDWELFRNALKFVHTTVAEREMARGDEEVYRSMGDVKTHGLMNFDRKFMRHNVHKTGNRILRWACSKGAGTALGSIKLIDDLLEQEGIVDDIFSVKTSNFIHKSLHELQAFREPYKQMFDQIEEIKKQAQAKDEQNQQQTQQQENQDGEALAEDPYELKFLNNLGKLVDLGRENIDTLKSIKKEVKDKYYDTKEFFVAQKEIEKDELSKALAEVQGYEGIKAERYDIVDKVIEDGKNKIDELKKKTGIEKVEKEFQGLDERIGEIKTEIVQDNIIYKTYKNSEQIVADLKTDLKNELSQISVINKGMTAYNTVTKYAKLPKEYAEKVDKLVKDVPGIGPAIEAYFVNKLTMTQANLMDIKWIKASTNWVIDKKDTAVNWMLNNSVTTTVKNTASETKEIVNNIVSGPADKLKDIADNPSKLDGGVWDAIKERSNEYINGAKHFFFEEIIPTDIKNALDKALETASKSKEFLEESKKFISSKLEYINTFKDFYNIGLDLYKSGKNIYTLSEKKTEAKEKHKDDVQKVKDTAKNRDAEQNEIVEKHQQLNIDLLIQTNSLAKYAQERKIVAGTGELITKAVKTFGGYDISKILPVAIEGATFLMKCFTDHKTLVKWFDGPGQSMVKKVMGGQQRLKQYDDAKKLEMLKDKITVEEEKLPMLDEQLKVDDAKIPVDRKVLDKIKRSMGFKDEEELMNFQGLKMVNALLFSASDYNPLEEPQILAKCTLMVLGLEDCIGKTDSDTAMKVFKTLKK